MPRAWLLGGAALLGVLLIGSVAVALLDEAEPLPEGTPEAAVQRYLKAAETEDYQLAYSLLSSTLRKHCTLEQFYGASLDHGDRIGDSRITLEDTDTLDDMAFVTVRITNVRGGGPFGTQESSFERRFTLGREDGEWRLTEAPWPYYRCDPPNPPSVVTDQPTPEPAPVPTSTPDSG